MTHFEQEILDIHVALENWLGAGEGDRDALLARFRPDLRNGAAVRHKKGPSHDGPFLTNGCLLAEQRFDIQTLPLQDFTQAT
ncbi:hypothetical protein ACNF0A_17975 [Enterobacter hormaechei]|uniref:hypothetical protein n=1 Tax=Enterobacter hormaechei TaxID=158836 RepID=UPI003CFAAEB9